MNHEYKSVGFVANGANLVDNMQWFVSATALVAYDGVFDVFVELGRVFFKSMHLRYWGNGGSRSTAAT